MGFWSYMLLINLPLPIAMIILGLTFCKKAPKSINRIFGYRTARAMKTRDTWEFAHRFCGRIWWISGLVLIPIVIAVMACLVEKDTKTVGYAGAVLLLTPLCLIVLSVLFTEKALKKTFDRNGTKIKKI